MSGGELRGVAVLCARCGLMKCPIGREVPTIQMKLCLSDSCAGYFLHPHVGCLWPGELESQYGHPSPNHFGTEPVPAQEEDGGGEWLLASGDLYEVIYTDDGDTIFIAALSHKQAVDLVGNLLDQYSIIRNDMLKVCRLDRENRPPQTLLN